MHFTFQSEILLPTYKANDIKTNLPGHAAQRCVQRSNTNGILGLKREIRENALHNKVLVAAHCYSAQQQYLVI